MRWPSLLWQDERNLPDPNADLFVSHIDFRELNRNKNPIAGLQVLEELFTRTRRGENSASCSIVSSLI